MIRKSAFIATCISIAVASTATVAHEPGSAGVAWSLPAGVASSAVVYTTPTSATWRVCVVSGDLDVVHLKGTNANGSAYELPLTKGACIVLTAQNINVARAKAGDTNEASAGFAVRLPDGPPHRTVPSPPPGSSSVPPPPPPSTNQ